MVAPRANPRLTGRAAVLVLVVAVLVVSFASSLKAYLQQRDHIDTMRAEIAQRAQAIDELETEKERWKDPAFVEQQARERFGYVMPGETAYVALDAHGNRIQAESTLTAPEAVGPKTPKAWWQDAWASVELAGDPPALDQREPARKINGAKEEKDQQ
jgi:cell division protein FtsB